LTSFNGGAGSKGERETHGDDEQDVRDPDPARDREPHVDARGTAGDLHAR
jgi:hypothetical protein